MSGYKYSTEITEKCAKAVGIALPVSRKDTVNICNSLRGLQVPKAKTLLENVTKLKQAIPFTRYNQEMAHRKGPMACGRFPVKACGQILKLLKSAEANAQFKGLSTANLVIKHISAQKGPTTMRYGRRRNLTKRTHVELVVEERKK